MISESEYLSRDEIGVVKQVAGVLPILRHVSQPKVKYKTGKNCSEKTTYMQQAQALLILVQQQLLLIFDTGQCVCDFSVYGPLLL